MGLIISEDYVIFEEHIVSIEKVAGGGITIYLVNGQEIKLFNDEADRIWQQFAAEPSPGGYAGG